MRATFHAPQKPATIAVATTRSRKFFAETFWHEVGHVLQNRYLDGKMPENARVPEGAAIEENALNILQRGKQFYFMSDSGNDDFYKANPEERHSKLFEDLGEAFGDTLGKLSNGAKK